MNNLSFLSDSDLLLYYNLKKESINFNKREQDTRENGFSTKFAYHVVRLLNEVEQILIEGDLDLERNREQLKSIRRGEWTEKQIIEYFHNKEKQLEEVYNKSTLQHSPDEMKIKTILLECLEMHYGSLSDSIKVTNLEHNYIIDDIIQKLNKLKY